MVRYTQGQITKWVEGIQTATTNRCQKVRLKVEEYRSLGTWEPGPHTHERLFASLFTGEATRLTNGYLSSDWTSWIENRPFYLGLCTHPRVVVDLVPCDLESFIKKYGCTPAQFVQLMLKLPDAIRVNIRNDDATTYAREAVAVTMGDILALSDYQPTERCFYRLSPIRQAAFGLLDLKFSAIEERAALLCSRYPKVERELGRCSPERLRIVTRDAAWPSHGQLKGRMAYYLAARELWPNEAADPVVDEWISCDSPLLFNEEPSTTAEHLARLYTTHHLYTAPLTGALGGTYGWAPEELDYAILNRTAGRHALNVPLSTWLFDLQAGIVKLPTSPALPYARHLSRRPTDDEWSSFLSVVEENRHAIRAYWRMLEEVFLTAGARVNPALRPDVNIDDFELVLAGIAPGRFEKLLISCVSSGAKIGASAGADVVGSAAHVSPKIVAQGAKLVGAAAEDELQQFKEGIGRIMWRRATRSALTRATASLRLPS